MVQPIARWADLQRASRETALNRGGDRLFQGQAASSEVFKKYELAGRKEKREDRTLPANAKRRTKTGLVFRWEDGDVPFGNDLRILFRENF